MYMIAKVPMIENGRARLGITVADTFRKNRKITAITRPSVINMVNWMSTYESRIVWDRWYRISMWTDGGSSDANSGSRSLTLSVTPMVLVPRWRWMASTIARCWSAGV